MRRRPLIVMVFVVLVLAGGCSWPPWKTAHDAQDAMASEDTADVLSVTDPDGDADGDGLSNAEEGLGDVDTDGDGVSDAEDLDADNDGIPDERDPDANGDGRDDALSGAQNASRDTVTDPYGDTDHDGLSNAEEGLGEVDTDRDGVSDAEDPDADGDGVADAEEGGVDTDDDGVADFRDADSDNDAIPDTIDPQRTEAQPSGCQSDRCDADGDGVPDDDDDCPREVPDQDDDGDGCEDDCAVGVDCTRDPAPPVDDRIAFGSCASGGGLPGPSDDEPSYSVLADGYAATCGGLGPNSLVADLLRQWAADNDVAIVTLPSADGGRLEMVMPVDLAMQSNFGIPDAVWNGTPPFTVPRQVDSIPGMARVDSVGDLGVDVIEQVLEDATTEKSIAVIDAAPSEVIVAIALSPVVNTAVEQMAIASQLDRDYVAQVLSVSHTADAEQLQSPVAAQVPASNALVGDVMEGLTLGEAAEAMGMLDRGLSREVP
jgi:hypothetical protein